MSENLKTLKNLELAHEDDHAIFTVDSRHSVLMEKIMTPERISELDLSDHQKAMLRDAVRIFTTFMEDGAPHWTCVDSHIVDEIRSFLKTGQAVDINIFAKAQAQVYATLQTDTFPRFLKALINNPERYSSGERLELPEDLRMQLKTVASQHEVLNREELVIKAVEEHAAETTFTSPRSSRRAMPTVDE